ncbi:hypothetical protein ABKA04_002210 [Annulohypoxylon sp. FPYF3050]
MATLMKLPDELLLMIANSRETRTGYSTGHDGQILGLRDLMNLTYVNRRLHSTINKVLYQFDRDDMGFNAPIGAINRNSIETLELIDRLGFSVLDDKEIRPPRNILHVACKVGHLRIVKWLVDKGAPMEYISAGEPSDNTAADFASSALAVVMNEKHVEVAIFLLSRGATPYLRFDVEGFVTTALHLATSLNLPELVKYLVQDRGMSVNITDSRGGSPLHFHLQVYGSFDPGDLHRVHPLWWESFEPEDHWPNNTVMVRILISLGADLNVEQNGVLPLAMALNKHAYAHAHLLLKAGAKVQPDSDVGPLADIPLYICINKHFHGPATKRMLLEELIKCGADPNKRSGGFTPLEYAFEFFSSSSAIGCLLELGASVGPTMPDGCSILDFILGRDLYSKFWVFLGVTQLVEHGARIDAPLVTTGESFLVGIMDRVAKDDDADMADIALPHVSKMISAAVNRGMDRTHLNHVLGRNVRFGVRGTTRAKICKILIEAGAVLEEPDLAATAASEFIVSDYQCYTKSRIPLDDALSDAFLFMAPMEYMDRLLTRAQDVGDERDYLRILARMGKVPSSEARKKCELIWGPAYEVRQLWDKPSFPELDMM